MSEPVISRAVLNRLKAPSELAFAKRILEMVASAAEPLETASSLACNMTDTRPETTSASAREAFLAAAAMSAPGAKYAQASHELARSLPVFVNKKAAIAARALRDLRCEFKRFSDLHVDGRLLPLSVFIAALELPPFEQLQRRKFHFTPELVRLRNEVIKEYLRIKQAIVLQPRCASEAAIKCSALGLTDAGSNNGLSDRVTAANRFWWESKLCQRSSLVTRWEAFERRWLQEKDGHAVIALQPLVGAVSAAQAILQSCKKQLVLPEPSASMQRMCTYRALQAFCSSISTLSRELLPVESSCLFLEASTVILAASIAEDAARSAAERALERRSPQVDSNSLLQSQSVRHPEG
ncbi:hypothetical protein, conserved [Eimeria tenella]|uniref:Uncharacterized protein n=1 Tax=Eimeria tenella TaxID=5802 RepID=U6KR16_EIMTE|nr:hypothetical protein, conserved [Eimeria tenella]CDJ40552.1 hypothetical protein, conserved [Eimeria tenella]|eukprot:XP_013231302.1 hypothetical protein, conserved [Eimeria tenella]